MKEDLHTEELVHLRQITQPWPEEPETDCAECQTSCQSACKTSCTIGNLTCEKRR